VGLNRPSFYPFAETVITKSSSQKNATIIMKKTALFLCLFGSLFFACSDGGSIENDADRLAELACEGEKTTDSERKQELKNQYAKLDKEIKVKYKNRDGDALHLADLYFKKLNDCLGYTPVH
jgi:hypothetical protein